MIIDHNQEHHQYLIIYFTKRINEGGVLQSFFRNKILNPLHTRYKELDVISFEILVDLFSDNKIRQTLRYETCTIQNSIEYLQTKKTISYILSAEKFNNFEIMFYCSRKPILFESQQSILLQ